LKHKYELNYFSSEKNENHNIIYKKIIKDSDNFDIKKNEFTNKIANNTKKNKQQMKNQSEKAVEYVKRLRLNPSYKKQKRKKNLERITKRRKNQSYKENETK